MERSYKYIKDANELNENISLYILNEQNKYITLDFVYSLLSKYDIKTKIKNLSLFQQAMTHESYILRDFKNDKGDKLLKMIKEKELEPVTNIENIIPLQHDSYERLEFLGDSVIHAVLAEYLFMRYPDKDEGFLTKLRTKIENGQTLSRLAKDLGLHEYVLLAKNIEQAGGRDKNFHIFEDTFESFLGALYVDSNYDFNLCKKFVINVIEKHIDTAYMIHTETNHKDTLLQHFHKMKWTDPEYQLLRIVEKNSKKYFHMGVKGPKGIIGTGTGSSKKKGEQKAAYNALSYLGIVKEDESDEEIYEVYEIENNKTVDDLSKKNEKNQDKKVNMNYNNRC